MAQEIERRFLVGSNGWQSLVRRSEPLVQGYLNQGKEGFTVRVRQGSSQAWLTLKAPTADPIVRHEFEYSLPLEDAQTMLALTPWRLEKTRHHLELAGGDWVVDVFDGENAPLLIAEVELAQADAPLAIPSWCGEEITGRGEFSNAALAVQPWQSRHRSGRLHL